MAAGRYGDALLSFAHRGGEALLTLHGVQGRRETTNLIARRKGQGGTLIISTPLSGWFACAGERGSGVAAWLDLARRLPRALPGRDLIFVGLTGHELENGGGRLFLDHAAPRPADTALWVHIGSAFATRDWPDSAAGRLLPLPSADPQRYLIASEELLPTVRRHAAGLPGLESPHVATAQMLRARRGAS